MDKYLEGNSVTATTTKQHQTSYCCKISWVLFISKVEAAKKNVRYINRETCPNSLLQWMIPCSNIHSTSLQFSDFMVVCTKSEFEWKYKKEWLQLHCNRAVLITLGFLSFLFSSAKMYKPFYNKAVHSLASPTNF